MPLRLLLAFAIALASGPARADLVVLLSDNKPSITEVAQAIQASYRGKIESYNLGGDPNRAGEVAAAIQSSVNQQVIAIGLLAAQTARRGFSSKQVVFCQVLNYEESDLVTPWMKGVSAIPSLQRQFRVWKMLDPSLRRIGVITGKDMGNVMAQARRAAQSNQLVLTHIEVGSDREFRVAGGRLAGQVQGLWLAPDSTVLSATAIRDVMSYSALRDIQVLVFSRSLLREGGLLSATADPAEIASLALGRLQQSQGMQGIVGDAVVPLSSAAVTVNAKAASRLGLALSAALRKNANIE
jgi:ABC-type uncharacterized transport system substrate-binding protein